MTEASCSSSQHLPLRHREREGKKKKKSFKVPGSIGENMRLRSYKHTFLLVLTCISKPPTRCSWNRNQTRVRALVHAGVTIASEHPPNPPCFFSPCLFMRSSMFRCGHVETSACDWLFCSAEHHIGLMLHFAQHGFIPPPLPSWGRQTEKVKRGVISLWYSKPQDAALYKKLFLIYLNMRQDSIIRFPLSRKDERDEKKVDLNFLFPLFVLCCFLFPPLAFFGVLVSVLTLCGNRLGRLRKRRGSHFRSLTEITFTSLGPTPCICLLFKGTKMAPLHYLVLFFRF